MTDYDVFSYLSSMGDFRNCFHIEGSASIDPCVLNLSYPNIRTGTCKAAHMQVAFFFPRTAVIPCYYRVTVLRVWLEGEGGLRPEDQIPFLTSYGSDGLKPPQPIF